MKPAAMTAVMPERSTAPPTLVSFDAAQAEYLRALHALATEQIRTVDAAGRVLRAPAVAQCDLPRFDQSAMDGYALRADDAHKQLTIAGRSEPGGSVADLPSGSCMRILTGAPIPAGADCVVPQENVAVADNSICLREPLGGRRHIRRQGEEFSRGTQLARAGQRLRAGEVGALAMAGIARLEVTRKVRIAVLVTGNEIRHAGESLEAHQIYDANGPMLRSALAQPATEVAPIAFVPDQRGTVQAALETALAQSDLVICSGGTSVGDKDYLPQLVEACGMHRRFWKVAQKPGKPLLFATRGNQALMALPGNPAAVLIGLALHVSTVLRVLEGIADPRLPWRYGRLAMPQQVKGDRPQLARASIAYGQDGVPTLNVLPGQASHMLANVPQSDAIVRLAPGNNCGLVPYAELT